MILNPQSFRRYVDRFNADDAEDVVNEVPNAAAWTWMTSNIPLFSCPDPVIEEIYYYRWWTFRKHIKQTPAGRIITEFITPVRHAGLCNSISCALGHHIAEGRWLCDQSLLAEYVRFWFHAGGNGSPEPKFHNYSSWLAAALFDRSCTTGNWSLPVDLLDDLVADYHLWESQRLLPNGLFWQYDVRDGMEESISGSRTHRNARPSINSYMYGNALAIAQFAARSGRSELSAEFQAKADALRSLVHQHLWHPQAEFFKAQTDEGPLCDAREAIGFIPWCFNLPRDEIAVAWKHLVDPQGFWAAFGITTAERRHPRFRSHGVGHCEWDGAVWPFATSQTLNALANVLRSHPQSAVTRQHYLHAIETYARSQYRNGKPYIGEYLDETTGEWLKGDNPRSRYYNHSTFADLIISGLVGLIPNEAGLLHIDPLLPPGTWKWFCLEGVPWHGRRITVLWDEDGQHFGRGEGLQLWEGDSKLGGRPDLGRWP